MAHKSDANPDRVELDIFHEAPAPKRKASFWLLFFGFLALWWAFEGAKIRPGELIQAGRVAKREWDHQGIKGERQQRAMVGRSLSP